MAKAMSSVACLEWEYWDHWSAFNTLAEGLKVAIWNYFCKKELVIKSGEEIS